MRKSISWRRPRWLLALYAALSLLDYGLTMAALRIGRMDLSPAAGGPYEGNPVAVWLFIHEGAVSVLLFKGMATVMGMLLLVIIRPMWTHYAWVRAVTWVLLGAGVVWAFVGVCSGVYVLV
jgi:hypothetical protein